MDMNRKKKKMFITECTQMSLTFSLHIRLLCGAAGRQAKPTEQKMTGDGHHVLEALKRERVKLK